MGLTPMRRLLNSLGLAPTRVCRYLNHCCLCDKPITSGQEYKDRGYGKRAHLNCFTTKSKEVTK